MSGKTAHILFCANNLYARHTATCIVSVLENSSMDFHNLYVAGRFDDAAVIAKLQETVACYDNATLKVIDFVPDAGLELPTRIHYTKDIFTRLWIEEFVGPEVVTVLYLDSDMIVPGDIAPLWNIDLKDALFGACDIPGSDRMAYLGIDGDYGYFNSGVLLFNMTRWRAENAKNTVISYIQDNAEKLIDPDQDALNACFYRERLVLDPVWNVITPYVARYDDFPVPKQRCREIVKKARVIHFNGRGKPWHYVNTHPWKEAYWRYLKMTPWKGVEPEGRSFFGAIKKNYNRLMPQAVKNLVASARGRG